MIIDAHAHACGDYLNAEQIIHTLDSNNVEKVILVPGELGSTKTYSLPPLAAMFPKRNVVAVTNRLTRLAIALSGAAKHIGEGNAYVHSMAAVYPKRILQFYWASARTETLLEEMGRLYSEWRFAGIKMHQCWESFRIRSELFKQVVGFAESTSLPLFIHLGSKRDVFDLVQVAQTHPEANIIVGHLFGLEYFIRDKKNLGNVYFEISSPALISEYRLRLALTYWGAHRLILGSDTPYGKNNLADNIQRIKALDISEEEKGMILGGNIRKLLMI